MGRRLFDLPTNRSGLCSYPPRPVAAYRLAGIKIGRDSSFHWRARFFRPWKLYIGNNTIIGNDAMLDATNGIEIGNNGSLSMGVRIWTLEHDPKSPTYRSVRGPVQNED